MARNAGSFNTYNGETGRLDETLFHPALETKTAAQWIAENKVLVNGEMVQESDTKLIKIGDGISNYPNTYGIPQSGFFGVRLSTDIVATGGKDIYMNQPKIGMEIETFYARLENQKVSILRNGLYIISATTKVSDMNGSYFLRSVVRSAHSGNLIDSTSHRIEESTAVYKSFLSISSVVYLSTNDAIVLTASTDVLNPYRISSETNMSIMPLRLK